jgi:hypothetical protein
MGEVSNSQTRLRATFRIKLNGEPVVIETIGQAYRFITSLSNVEWMEFKSLHADRPATLMNSQPTPSKVAISWLTVNCFTKIPTELM